MDNLSLFYTGNRFYGWDSQVFTIRWLFSSFKVENGNCIHEEDQEFLDKVTEAIERNITNPDLSVELLSSDLGYSTRQFYRKLKPLTEKSPADIIKEYRLVLAERLLLSKNLTTEEIMDQTGFNSRGTFYKLFTQRFGMPPRQYKEQQMNNVKGVQSGCGSPNVDSDKI